MSTKESIIDQVHDKGLDMRTRTIFLQGDIDEDVYEKFSRNMHLLEKGTGEITIKLCSGGGHVSFGWGIYDLIKESKHFIRVVVEAKCESMATIILQAADERIIHKNARMMIHVGSESYEEQHAVDVRRWQAWGDKEEKKTQEIYLEKIREKKPRYTKEKLQKLLEFDTILSPKEAIALGLLDKVFGE
jgi:ATP-dependent protease ClpP protease subunit